MVRLSPSKLDVGTLKSVNNTPPLHDDAQIFYNEPTNIEQQLSQSTARLWMKLKDALDNSARERIASQRAQAQALVGLDQAFTPHGQEARLKARGFLSANAKVLVRMQAAANALEVQASAAQAAHTADEAQWHRRTQQLVSATKATGDATARVLLQEVKRCELEAAEAKEALLRRMADESHEAQLGHQREVRAMRQQFELEREGLHDELTALREALEASRQQAQSERQQARLHHDALSEDIHRSREQCDRLTADLARDRAALEGERLISLEHSQENAKLRAEMATISAELESTRLDLQGQVERLTRDKRAMELEYQSQLAHAQRLRDDEVASLQASMAKMRDVHTKANLGLQSQLEAVQTDRQSDALAYESKISRLQALQKAALAAGSARGRQMLYTESVRSPELWRASSLSWRGADWEPSKACASPRVELTSSSATSPRLARSASGSRLGSPRGSPTASYWSSSAASHSHARSPTRSPIRSPTRSPTRSPLLRAAASSSAKQRPSPWASTSASDDQGSGRRANTGTSTRRWTHHETAAAIAAAATGEEALELADLAEQEAAEDAAIAIAAADAAAHRTLPSPALETYQPSTLSVSLTAQRKKDLFTSVFTPP